MERSERQLYRLAKTPSGRKLWAYMAGILEVTGMAQGKISTLENVSIGIGARKGIAVTASRELPGLATSCG